MQPAGLLEFGTYIGAFSRWLADRVAWFRTFDVYKPEQPPPGFRLGDVLHDGRKIRRLICHAPRPFVLFCDNGHKIHEVQTYAPSLCENDYLAVHDLGTEIHPSDIPHRLSEVLAQGRTGFYRVSSQRSAAATWH
jgi:hypothetical protein